MRSTRNSLIFSSIAIAALASQLGAQDRMRAGDNSVQNMMPAQRTFAQEYLSAITSPDIERYKKLLHPRTRACINAQNADFFNSVFERRVNRVARNPQTRVEKIKDFKMFHPTRSNGLSYPSRPSHVFHIDLVNSGSRQSALGIYAVRENGIWYEVLPCPSSKSLEMMRESQRRDAAETIHARALADSLQEPLRAELLALLQEEGPVSATRRYAEATQADLTLARRVVKALEKDLTLIH